MSDETRNQSETLEFDYLIQRLRQQLDRRSLGRLAAGAAGTVTALHVLEDATAGKKKKKKKGGGGKKGNKKNKATTPAPTTAVPTTAGPTTTSTTTSAPPAIAYEFAEEIGKHANFVPAGFDELANVATDPDGNVYVLDRYRYRISKSDANGENGVMFGSPGEGEGQFSNPGALAVDADGQMYVSDEIYIGEDYAERIQVLKANGQHEAYLADPPTPLAEVTGIAVRPSDGHIFASVGWYDEGLHSAIYEWNATFGFEQVWEDLPNGVLAIDTADRLYVWNSESSNVAVYSTTNNTITEMTTFGSGGTGDGQFAWVYGIAVDGANNVFVSDESLHRVQQFTWNNDETALDYVATFGTQGSGEQELNGPSSVAVGSNGKIYIADVGNRRIQQLSSALIAESQWEAQPGEFISPTGVARDSDGTFYVADSEGHRIHKLSSNGAVIEQWGGTQGSGDGQFSYPYGIALTPTGEIYISDQANYRIQVLDTDGVHQDSFTDIRFASPSSLGSIAFDAAGNLYVVAPEAGRVEKYDTNHDHITGWDGSGTGGRAFVYPVDIAVIGNRVYVTDYDDGAVKIFNLDGVPQLIIDLTEPGVATADSQGRIFIGSGADGQIHVFSALGVEISSFGESGEDPGELSYPGQLQFTPNGDLIVLDYNTGVMRFVPSAGRAARRDSGNGGDGKRADAKQKQNRKRKGGNDRNKRRNQRNEGPRGRGRNDGRGKGGPGRERNAERRQKGRDRRD